MQGWVAQTLNTLVHLHSVCALHVTCQATRLVYDEAGDAFLQEQGGSQRAVSELPWQQVALVIPDGRIFINTVVPGTDDGTPPSYGAPVWLSDLQRSFGSYTLRLTKSLAFTVQISKGGRVQQGGGEGGVTLDPRAFWDLRDVKASLCIDYGGPVFHNTWVAENFKNFSKIWGQTGFPENALHLFRNEKSFHAREKNGKKGKKGTKDAEETALAVPGLMGVGFLENVSLSIISLLYAYIHWSKKLASTKAKESAMLMTKALSDSTLRHRRWAMRISASDFILGVVPSTGAWVHMTGSTILDATPLVQELSEIGKALKSKTHRDE